MEELLAYLNSLDKPARRVFCGDIGTSEGYLRKAIHIGGRFKAELCAAIEAASCGAVTRKQLRPEDWARAWPELVYINVQLHRVEPGLAKLDWLQESLRLG